MIKKILILIPIILSSLVFSQENYKNVHLFKASPNSDKNMEILNIFSNSAMYAYWANKILNGSGTRSSLSPKIAESTTYQFLRILSLFDIYFNHSALALESSASGKKHFVYFSTLMTNQEINSYPRFSLSGDPRLTALAYGLFPLLGRQQLRTFTPRDILYFDDGPLFSQKFRNRVHDKLKEKLAYVWDRAFSLANSMDQRKEQLNGIMMPLTVLSDLHIDKTGDSYYNFSLYLPGLVNIDRKNKDGKLSNNPMDWKLVPGLEQKLERPIKGLAQIIEKISYLNDIPEETKIEAIKDNLIGLHFSKNLRKPDELEMSIEFGQIPSKAQLSEIFEKEDKKEKKLRIFPINLKKRKGALKVEGHINLAAGNLVNKYLNKFHLQAWIHKLTFDLKRPKKYKTWAERFEKNPTYELVNNIKKTILSVRLKKGANSSFHKFVLTGMGFTCKEGHKFMKEENIPVLKNYKYTCVADFSNSKEFNSKFFSPFGKPMIRKLIGQAAYMEMAHLVKDLDKIPMPDLQMENALAAEVFKLLKKNQVILEILNQLPGGLTTHLEGP
ncbi:MAG: hypothetical protein DRQ88_01270 [Epsilonproteobacteria bacterium]|nr:MAG: hypothetical protein DRQ89_05340 [Campylobacterota bacterium]RLA67924.1 MAG: hypothetical protein DRQ88_01270 [Campylobacterota bacterium]